MIVPDFVVVVFEGFGHFAVGVDVDVGFDDGGGESGFAGCQGGGAEFLFLDLGDDRPGVVRLALIVSQDFGELLVGGGGGLVFWRRERLVVSFVVMIGMGEIDVLFVFG